MRLFVYGTLRRADHRGPLLADARRLGTFRLDGYVLHDLGAYPGAVPGDGSITGELVEFGDEALLGALDRIEGVHERPPLYRRVSVEVDGAPAWLYVYARDVRAVPRIASGDWLARG